MNLESTFLLFAFGLGGHAEALPFGLRLDPLSLSMAIFIAFLGFIIHRFSARHFEGEARRRPFLLRLHLTLGAAVLQALSPSLVQFAVCWLLVSLGLQGLLQTASHRPEARHAARLKFLFSRLGDLAMVGAILSALGHFGGTGLETLAGAAPAAAGISSPLAALPAPAYFLVFAAFFKTACLPFQGWLLGSLEAPTPVSALLHAGIINAGGFLLIRFHLLFEGQVGALVLLALLVLPSVVLGPLAMWAQTDYKRGLAWSTVGQMGFMLLQCALGAFAPALLHLFGHGLYKANAFLRSGTLAGMAEIPAPSPSRVTLKILLPGGLAAAFLGLGLGYALLAGSPGLIQGGWTLFSIQGLALAQLAASPSATSLTLRKRMSLVAAFGFLYAAGTALFEKAFHPVLSGLPSTEALGTAGLFISALTLAALGLLAFLWLTSFAWPQRPLGRALHIAAAHGFYLNFLFARKAAS